MPAIAHRKRARIAAGEGRGVKKVGLVELLVALGVTVEEARAAAAELERRAEPRESEPRRKVTDIDRAAVHALLKKKGVTLRP